MPQRKCGIMALSSFALQNRPFGSPAFLRVRQASHHSPMQLQSHNAPAFMQISKASAHDRPIAGEMLEDVYNIRLFADMALLHKGWQAQMLTENNVEILTPIKLKMGQDRLPFADKLLSRAISSVKQAIESFNNWLIEKTSIQKASKVRSATGLLVFLFARVACVCFGFDG